MEGETGMYEGKYLVVLSDNLTSETHYFWLGDPRVPTSLLITKSRIVLVFCFQHKTYGKLQCTELMTKNDGALYSV